MLLLCIELLCEFGEFQHVRGILSAAFLIENWWSCFGLDSAGGLQEQQQIVCTSVTATYSVLLGIPFMVILLKFTWIKKYDAQRQQLFVIAY